LNLPTKHFSFSKSIKISLFLTFGALIIFQAAIVFANNPLLQFLETYFSSDDNITNPSIVFWRIRLAIGQLGLLGTIFHQLKEKIKTLFSFEYWKKLGKFQYSANIFLIFLGLSWTILRNRNPSIYLEDGVFETMTVMFYILSIALLATTKQKKPWVLLLGLLFLLIALEEISYGQRIFGIQTPLFLSKINTQNEINLHNIYSIIYFQNFIFLITGLFLVFSDELSDWLGRNLSLLREPFEFLASGKFLLFGFALLSLNFTTPNLTNEFAEEIISLAALTFSLSIYQADQPPKPR